MPDWPAPVDCARHTTVGDNAATSGGTTLTASATANTKGSYVELVASTPWAVEAIDVSLQDASAIADFLVDIAIGAAGSEKIVIPDLLVTGNNGAGMGNVKFPIAIASGQRISARCQSTDVSATIEIALELQGRGGFLGANPLGRVTAYGPDTADSGGVAVDPGATAHTKGAWAEIVASTGKPIKWVVIAIGERNNAVLLASNWLIDIGVGAAASEKIIVPDLFVAGYAGADAIAPPFFSKPLRVASGQRLAARAQCSITDATDRILDVAIYGVD